MRFWSALICFFPGCLELCAFPWTSPACSKFLETIFIDCLWSVFSLFSCDFEVLSSAFFQVLSNSVRLPEPLLPAPKFRKRFLFIASGQFFSRFQAILKCRGAKTLRWWCAKCLSFKTLFFTWVIFYSVFLRKFWLFLVDFFRYFPTPHYSPSSEHFRKGRANDFFCSVYPRSVQAQEIEGLRTACLEWRVERVGFADRVRPVFPTQFFYDRYFAKTVCNFLIGLFFRFFQTDRRFPSRSEAR